MMGYCFNPECKLELRYLSQGSVYQWETGIGREFPLGILLAMPRLLFNI